MTRADDLFPTLAEFTAALRALRLDVTEHSVSIGYPDGDRWLIGAHFCVQVSTDRHVAQALADALNAAVLDERGHCSIPVGDVLDRATRARRAG